MSNDHDDGDYVLPEAGTTHEKLARDFGLRNRGGEAHHRRTITDRVRSVFSWPNVGVPIAILLGIAFWFAYQAQEARVQQSEEQAALEREERQEANAEARRLVEDLTTARETVSALNAQLLVAIEQIKQLGGTPLVSGTPSGQGDGQQPSATSPPASSSPTAGGPPAGGPPSTQPPPSPPPTTQPPPPQPPPTTQPPQPPPSLPLPQPLPPAPPPPPPTTQPPRVCVLGICIP